MPDNERSADQADWAPSEILHDRPNVARIYDCYLGGYHNFEADRRVAALAEQVWPDIRLACQANRAFLRRAVRFLVDRGMDQLIDLGSGLPTMGNVHEVAQALNPDVRVLYLDIDPVVISHSQAMLKDNPRAMAVRKDATQPATVWRDERVNRLLDLSKPVGLLALALLPNIPDDNAAYSMMTWLRDAAASGSYLAISHATYDNAPEESLRQLQRLYEQSGTGRSNIRSHGPIREFFGDWQLVPPGLVYLPEWRPETDDEIFADEPTRCVGLGGLACKT